MNDLIVNSNVLTMSTREIAALLEKPHSNIKISAERLAEKGVISTLAMQEFVHNGNTYTEYLLNKRDSLVLVAQNSPEFTARIVDRWQELESGQFAIPTTLSGALMLAAQQAEQIEKQNALIAQQAPAVAFVERFVDADGLHNVRQTAKALEIPEKEFVSRCIAAKVLYRTNKALTGYQQWKDAGYLTHKEDEANGKARLQVMFTPKGIAWLGKRLIKAKAQVTAAESENQGSGYVQQLGEPPHVAALRALGIKR